MSDREQAAAALIILLHDKKMNERKKKKRSVWTKSWLNRKEELSHMTLIRTLENQHSMDFKNYLRMSEDLFNKLLDMVRPLIIKQETNMRSAIPPEERLAATLRYLAAGGSLENLKFSTVISAQSLGIIIPETCRAIIQVLRDEYMKFPQSSAEWLKIAQDFNNLWQFPNCGGAIDGKHIRMQPPPNTGSYYYNYKGYHSIVLMAIVDANLEFIFVDVGANGRLSDGGVFDATVFANQLRDRTLNLPTADDTEANLNFVFIGDEAFPLHENFLKPFSRKNLTNENIIFNYRLSRARRVVENAFGILASRFRLFHEPITLKPEKVEIIVLACCMLHNFLRRNNRASYSPRGYIDQEDIESGTVTLGEWRQEARGLDDLEGPRRGINPVTSAKTNRDNYVTYFNGVGAVSWQHRMAFPQP